MKFCLTVDCGIVDMADAPQLLAFDLVEGVNRWSVWVWYENPHQFSEVATVDATGYSDSYASEAVAEVRAELSERFNFGEFNYPENWVDCRAIAIGEED